MSRTMTGIRRGGDHSSSPPFLSAVRLAFRAAGVVLLCSAMLQSRAEEPAGSTINAAPELPATLPWDLARLRRPP
ncbi:MAG: hypothetical protein WD060_00135, partial [Pirellulales bacterium]